MVSELYGHRGAAGEAPENTLAGFAHAWRIGVRSFELDVRLSSDLQLVVLHDETLLRTVGIEGKVGDFTAAELAAMDARSTCTHWPDKAGIPLLHDVLKTHADGVRSWELEIKSAPVEKLEILCPKLIEQVRKFGIDERVVITSFDPNALEIMRRLDPKMRRAFISHYDQPEHLETAIRLGCYRACIPLKYSSKQMVRAAHSAGLNVTGWQGDTVEMLETLLDWGVDAITSNQPTLALSFLRKRGILS